LQQKVFSGGGRVGRTIDQHSYGQGFESSRRWHKEKIVTNETKKLNLLLRNGPSKLECNNTLD
jgi:hypothetical protein